MIILIFMFIGTAVYALKYGVGKERLMFLYPVGLWLLVNVVYGIVVTQSPSSKNVVQFVVGIPTTIILIIACVWVVKSIRDNSMKRVLTSLENGTFKNPEKKLEL